MSVRECQCQKKWNDFIVRNNGSFLQSGEWGKVQKSFGRDVWYLADEENGEIKKAILLIKYNLPLSKSYLFSPWASLIDFSLEKIWLNKIQEIAKKEKAIFFRYEPMVEQRGPTPLKGSDPLSSFIYVGEVEPQHTLIVDLKKSEAEILEQMHTKTRYNIKLAQNKGVIITSCDFNQKESEHMFDEFWRLIENTYERKGVVGYLKKYYQKIFEQPFSKLYVASFENKIIVANLVIFFGKTATYLYGGSDKEYQKTMATSLIQWQAIKDAKEQGYEYYDFYGISDIKSKWSGITRFKRGFGGEEKKYVGAWDLVFSGFWYRLYQIVKKLRSF
jgi:lipid II:glycine glycyltransferase (peptidoglycan interpeptide bridge formation enzyme)